MYRKAFTTLILASLIVVKGAFASDSPQHEDDTHHAEMHAEHAEESDPKSEITETITHHLLDDHDFTITHGLSIPLPVILVDEGLQVFSSSKFHHGETVAENNGNYYKVYHGKIYKTDAEGTISYDEAHHPTNAAPLDLSITKTVVGMLITVILMIWMFTGVANGYKKSAVPTGMAKFLEPLIVFVRDEIAKPNIAGEDYKKYMPFLLTVFFFVWISNLLGMTPLGLNITGNIAITFGLAIITFLITQFTSKKDYWMHIFWMPGVPWPMKIILAPIELLGVFIKPFALMIRLYANMKAGHTVLMSLIGLMYIFSNWGAKGAFFGLTFALSLLELLVAALQAYIFTMLSALYFGAAAEDHHAHEAEHVTA